MAYKVTGHGCRLSLSKHVPRLAVGSLQEPFRTLVESNSMQNASPVDFDWALHPGGIAIIKGTQKAMELPDTALEATNEIYRTRGNASSVAVLAVLDKLRFMEMRKRDVIACSFGPGLTTEMLLLRRLR
jgi:type III polyketide synthase